MTQTRLPSLTGLRWIAAFMVFGFHISVVGLVDTGSAGAVLRRVFGQGAVGVSFFFILSGFVLAWSARAGDTPRRFWQRRFAKIYPNHFVTWVPALAVAILAGTTITAPIVFTNLFLVHAWVPDIDVFYGMNSVSWSLACEAFFYLMFPVVFAGLRRLPERALWPSTVATMAVIWLIPVAVRVLPEDLHYWAIWVFPVSRLPEFVLGILLARVVRAGRWPNVGTAPFVVLAVAAYIASAWLPFGFRIVAGTAIPLALLIAAVAVADVQERPFPLRTRWAVWLGEVSYAFYLLHLLGLRLVARVFGADHPVVVEVGLVLVTLGAAVFGSWLLYIWVERPAMRIFGPRRRSDAPTPQPVPADPIVPVRAGTRSGTTQ
ncbi:acyltransferase family protein [Virgisporangium aurantiacum]|uniref:Acyltransferase n=1 Tax=Virgisporangium aurantiacum TaxID=175570 RepID=A0A8J3ZDT9_9ACTN|nr:acyltransferase [Virgisporangium aurantiacum]GIJ59855.1 acyltransferase [Virgisporangium aurantiacum]